MRKRNLLVVVAVVALMIVMSSCDEDDPTSYKVIHETGLYPSITSENPTLFLQVGSIVTPANGAKTLSCTTTTVAGIAMELCQVDVTATNTRGWVLKKWIEKQ